MPEHRAATPAALRDLESFLWRDFLQVADWLAWVEAHGGAPGGVTTCLEEVLAVQRALRALAASNNALAADAEAAAAILNGAAARHALAPEVAASGRARLRSPPGDPLGLVLGLALQAMWSGEWRRFKLCREPTCRASYFDASRNASKTWCEMQSCGSRSKMRRFRARMRQA